MFELIEPKESQIKTAMKMRDMEPLQFGVIVDGLNKGHLVMRTAAKSNFEVMDISNPEPDGWWNKEVSLMVELLPPGTEITLKVTGEK
ncbi:MAG: hypothetical protein WC319_08230 [Candidatus Paceibacterota bacterium]|jgi:hypothetical protein